MPITLEEKNHMKSILSLFLSISPEHIEESIWDMMICAFSFEETDDWDSDKRNTVLFTCKTIIDVTKALFALEDQMKSYLSSYLGDEDHFTRLDDENPLHQAHDFFSNLSLDFRDKVCKACDWTIPTFYRKMRYTSSTLNTGLTSQEEEEVLQQVENELNRLKLFIGDLKNRDNSEDYL